MLEHSTRLDTDCGGVRVWSKPVATTSNCGREAHTKTSTIQATAAISAYTVERLSGTDEAYAHAPSRPIGSKSICHRYTPRVEHNRRRTFDRFAAVAAVVGTALAIGVVALASERRAPHRQPGTGVPGLLKNLGVALVVVYMAVAIYALVAVGFRRAQTQTSRSRNDWASVLALVAIVLLVSLVVTKLRRSDDPKIREIVSEVGTPGGQPLPPPPSTGRPATWGWQLGFGLVLLIALVSVVLAVRSRRQRVSLPEPPDRRTLVAVSLDDLLSELAVETDPRRAVLLADRGMEMALAEHGLPRGSAETANEYSARVAAELSLSNSAAQTLTSLYSIAHFSSSELVAADRTAAIDALRSVRDELRAIPVLDPIV